MSEDGALSGLPSYPRRLAPWLWRARTFCLALAVCAAGVALVMWVRSEPAFRWIGLALQLLGVATVAYGIRQTRSLFEQSRWHERLRAWWQSRPKVNVPIRTVNMSAGIGVTFAFGDAELRGKPGPEAGVERRIQFL